MGLGRRGRAVVVVVFVKVYFTKLAEVSHDYAKNLFRGAYWRGIWCRKRLISPNMLTYHTSTRRTYFRRAYWSGIWCRGKIYFAEHADMTPDSQIICFAEDDGVAYILAETLYCGGWWCGTCFRGEFCFVEHADIAFVAMKIYLIMSTDTPFCTPKLNL